MVNRSQSPGGSGELGELQRVGQDLKGAGVGSRTSDSALRLRESWSMLRGFIKQLQVPCCHLLLWLLGLYGTLVVTLLPWNIGQNVSNLSRAEFIHYPQTPHPLICFLGSDMESCLLAVSCYVVSGAAGSV